MVRNSTHLDNLFCCQFLDTKTTCLFYYRDVVHINVLFEFWHFLFEHLFEIMNLICKLLITLELSMRRKVMMFDNYYFALVQRFWQGIEST